MVRQLDRRDRSAGYHRPAGRKDRKGREIRTPAWKAALAVTVAGAAVLWHLLACTESPMAFSPGGRELAFVTMEPYDNDDMLLAGRHCFRLMVLKDFKQLRVIEETTKHMLTAPAYSPDGKHICYLRLPLLTQKQVEQLKETIEKQQAALAKVMSAQAEWPTSRPATQPATAPASRKAEAAEPTAALPSPERTAASVMRAMSQPLMPAEMIVREARSLDVAARIPVSLPVSGGESDKDLELSLAVAYTTIRPQFSPDGKRVYLCAGGMVWGVDPFRGRSDVVVLPAQDARLSPDGRTLAVLQEEAIGLLRTDGRTATYRRWKGEGAWGTFAWKDNDTLALLDVAAKEEMIAAVRLVRRDGSDAGRIKLNLPKVNGGAGPPQLAISPDGKSLVLCCYKAVFFMDAKGKILKHWKGDGSVLAQPTFTPDSRHVAMKLLDEDEKRTAAVVLFTAAGKETARAAVPKSELVPKRAGSEKGRGGVDPDDF